MDQLERIRVATLQYFIRPVQSFEQFYDQVIRMAQKFIKAHSKLPHRNRQARSLKKTTDTFLTQLNKLVAAQDKVATKN